MPVLALSTLNPYDKSTFKDRYTRQHRMEPCSTIVAHLSKDGLMFIHPTQNRSLTPRDTSRAGQTGGFRVSRTGLSFPSPGRINSASSATRCRRWFEQM